MKKVCATIVVLLGAAVAAQRGESRLVEWPYWGGDAANSRYSTIPDITPQNVGQLQRAWTWSTGEQPRPEYGTRPSSFESTPLMIDNVLYLSTPFHRVVALDAETGEQRWAYDSEASKGLEDSIGFKHRGVAAWRNGNDLRIFLNTDSRLIALDAKTGKPVPSFGQQGVASLTTGLRLSVKKLHFSQTSPPVVYKNLVIVGSRIPDRIQYKFEPQGTVQAFDVRTGKRVWIFYTIPQSSTEFGAETWEKESWKFTGHANVWGPMTVDDAHGLLYVPVSTPSIDYYGGRRLGANLFAESLVCLDANTGQRKWHFQAVHHGLWDYDFPSAPTLATITVEREADRRGRRRSRSRGSRMCSTGCPASRCGRSKSGRWTRRRTCPGERPYPTQPFPTKPPAFTAQGVSLDDANDLTPEIKALATAELKKFRLGPLFTPPSLRGTVQRPSTSGGANWGGAAFDPETGMLYLRTSEQHTVNQVCKNDGTLDDLDVESRTIASLVPRPTSSSGATGACPHRREQPVQ